MLITDGFFIHSSGPGWKSELPLAGQAALLRKVLSKGKWIHIKIFREELEDLGFAYRPLHRLAV